MELVKIDAAEYGLEENKAKQISDMFKPMLDEMVGLEKEYNGIVKLEMSPEASVQAKALRLKYVKIRTGTSEVHKELKQFYLQGGRFVDGWKNAQLMASQGIEENLKDIEEYADRIEEARIEKLQESRYAEAQKHVEDELMIPQNMGEMSEDVWLNYVAGLKATSDARIAAEKKEEEERIASEKKAEEDRIAKEKAEAEDRARIEKENEELKKASELAEKKRVKDEAAREKVEQERLLKEKADAKIREEKERKEREEKDAIEAELKSKNEAEAKAKAKEEEHLQAELKKGDEGKLKDLTADLNALKSKYTFKSKKNQAMYKGVGELIDKVTAYINK